MKIVVPVLGFAREGGYRVLAELANAWHRRGHEITFLSPDSSEDPYFPTTANVAWVNGEGAVSTSRKSRAAPSARYHLTSLYRGLKSVGRHHDIVLANHSLTAWPVALAPCGAARKLYYVQGYEPGIYAATPSARNWVLAALSATSYHFRLERIVNAPIYLRYLNLRARHLVEPGIDLGIFHPSDSVRDLRNADTIQIGCIGRREPTKGTLYALRAFEELHRQNPRYRLKVAYGNLPPDWNHPHCEVVVPRNDRELAAFYRSLDILIAPGTIQHGAPHYPVLESWACGVSVVTTGYMGATEDTAWLVRNRDAMSICSAVDRIVADPAARRRRLEQGLARARGYAWEKVADEMLALFA